MSTFLDSESFRVWKEEERGAEGGNGRGRLTDTQAGVAGEISIVIEFGVDGPRQ